MCSARGKPRGRSPSWLSRGEAMRTWLMLGVLMVVGFGILRPALGDGWKHERGQGRWWRGEWKDEFRDGPCQVKREAKRPEFTREITCKDGVGAR